MSQHFNIFRCKTEPELFARAREHQRDEQQRGVAAQREEPGDCMPAAHCIILSTRRAEKEMRKLRNGARTVATHSGGGYACRESNPVCIRARHIAINNNIGTYWR